VIEELEKVYNDVWTAFVGNHLDAHRAALAAVAEHVRKGASAPNPKAELTEERVCEIADEFRKDGGFAPLSEWDPKARAHMVRTVNAALARHSVPFWRELSDEAMLALRVAERDQTWIDWARACIKAAVTLPEGVVAYSVKGGVFRDQDDHGNLGEPHFDAFAADDEECRKEAEALARFPALQRGTAYTVFIPDTKPKTQTVTIRGHEFPVAEVKAALGEVES